MPDVSGITNEFDYTVSADEPVDIGTIVRIDLHGRRVRGWITGLDVEPPAGVKLRSITKISGVGPDGEIQQLARWAASRWTGAPSHYLGTGDPPRNIRSINPRPHNIGEQSSVVIHTLAPAVDPYDLVSAAVAGGPCLVLVPEARWMTRITKRLRKDGFSCVEYPDGWAAAATGGVSVVGTRSAVWARMPEITKIVMLDCHDQAYWSEASPTWNAFDVAVQRSRQRQIEFLAVSPVPRATQLASASRVVAEGSHRQGWAPLHVVDMRTIDPHLGMYSDVLTKLLRSEARVVCVLNRKDRAQLLVCATCDSVASCQTCGSAERLTQDTLVCRRCNTSRTVFCVSCGSTRLKQLRQGITKVAEELEVLSGRSVGEVSSTSKELPDAPILVGTEATLHRVGRADAVVFLEFDQELMADRYKAEEDALVLLARASRLVGGRKRSGVVIVQTRIPDSDVIRAALEANPAMFSEIDTTRRQALGWPPYSVLARVTGSRSAQATETLPPSVDVLGPSANGTYILLGPDHQSLATPLQKAKPKRGELRVEIDPARA